jgi:hypothetical protein
MKPHRTTKAILSTKCNAEDIKLIDFMLNNTAIATKTVMVLA